MRLVLIEIIKMAGSRRSFYSFDRLYWRENEGCQEEFMGNKLCPKVILEGTRLTFKAEIAFELNEHPRVVGPHKCSPAPRAPHPRCARWGERPIGLGLALPQAASGRQESG